MKNWIFKEDGITLIELIIVIAIIGIVSSAIYLSYFDSIRVWSFNQDRIEVQQTQDIVNRWLERYARQAKTVTIIDNSDLDQLIIEYNSGDTTNEIIFKIENKYFASQINGGNIRKISDLKFEELNFNFDNNLIDMTAVVNNSKETKTYNFNNLYYPRLLN